MVVVLVVVVVVVALVVVVAMLLVEEFVVVAVVMILAVMAIAAAAVVGRVLVNLMATMSGIMTAPASPSTALQISMKNRQTIRDSLKKSCENQKEDNAEVENYKPKRNNDVLPRSVAPDGLGRSHVERCQTGDVSHVHEHLPAAAAM